MCLSRFTVTYMKKSSKKKGTKASKSAKTHFPVFLVLAIVAPFAVFFVYTLICMFRGGDITVKMYFENFKFLWEKIKVYEEYAFPCAIFTLLCLVCVFIRKLSSRKVSIIGWTVLSVVGALIILFGSRILFIVTRKYFGTDVLPFLYSAVNVYSIALSLTFDFIVCSISKCLDDVILSK